MTPTARLSTAEFIALAAMLSSTIAFSIDAMLPAMDQIARDLTPEFPNRAQLIITSFVLGMGVGTFFTGPASDAFGRRPVLIGGAVIFIAGSLLAIFAPTLELVLLARVIQGFGAAAPRVVTLAVVRDLFSGREMARIVSFIMVVFTIVPAIAPSIGAYIIAFSSWRGVFGAFVLFALISAGWFAVRQPETLAPAHRRPFQMDQFKLALREMFALPTVRLSLVAQMLAFGMLFTVLSTTQPIFNKVFDEADTFHLWYMPIAVVAGSFGLINALLVVRLGMRNMILAAFISQIAFSLVMVAATLWGISSDLYFWIYVIWVTSVFAQIALTLGNLNALALEPLGHIAGTVASMLSAFSTVGAVFIAVPLGLAFDGTPLWPALGIGVCAVLASWVAFRLPRETG